MKCPTCPDAVLVMTDRQGVEIDYCPNCRGMWLDRGELDKLIERSDAMPPTRNANTADGSHPRFADADHDYGRGPYGRRRKSWLSEIFD